MIGLTLMVTVPRSAALDEIQGVTFEATKGVVGHPPASRVNRDRLVIILTNAVLWPLLFRYTWGVDPSNQRYMSASLCR